MPRLAIGRSSLVVLLFVASRAAAQPAGNVTLDAFRPAIDSRGYGETQPIDKRHDEAAYRKNRRVDFVLRKRTED